MRPISEDRAFMRGIKVCLSSLERVLHGHLGLVEQLVARFRHTFWPIVESIGHIYMAHIVVQSNEQFRMRSRIGERTLEL